MKHSKYCCAGCDIPNKTKSTLPFKYSLQKQNDPPCEPLHALKHIKVSYTQGYKLLQKV